MANSPTKRETRLRLNLDDAKQRLRDCHACIKTIPDEARFDIRSDLNGPYVAISAMHEGRKAAFRLNAAIEGDASDFSFPFDAVDFLASDTSGHVTLSLFPRCLTISRENQDLVVGAIPDDAGQGVFPPNGYFEIDHNATARVRRFIEVSDELNFGDFGLRVHGDSAYLYATNGFSVAVCELKPSNEVEPALWDVEIPREVVLEIAERGAILDYMHGVGVWISDGANFFYKGDAPGYLKTDVPGIVRTVRACSNRMVINEDVYSVLGDSGYRLLFAAPGCIDVYQLNPETMSYHDSLEFTDSKYLQAAYRGDKTGAVLDSRTVSVVCGDRRKARLYMTGWPLSPYVVSDGDVSVAVMPPVVNPGSVARILDDLPEDVRGKLRNWTGTPERLSIHAFEDTSTGLSGMVYPDPEINLPHDALFLLRAGSRFIRVGNVDRVHLGSCMFEFTHSDVYTQDMVDRLHSGRLWPGLRVYVYDAKFQRKHEQQVGAPSGWATWGYWSDPEGTASRDKYGNVDSAPEVLERRSRARVLTASLSAPKPVVPEESVEIPEENAGGKPITEVELIDGEPDPQEDAVPESNHYDTLIIDSHYVTWRDWYQKSLRRFQHPFTGKKTGMAFGFMRATRNWVRAFRPSKVIAVWDCGCASWRKEIIPGYKDRGEQKSKLTDEDFESIREQREWIREGLPLLGVNSVRVPDTEADDVIALLADAYGKKGSVVIVTGDYDLNHVVTDSVHVWQDRKQELVDDPSVAGESLLRKVIEGDSSDNIGGVPDVGKKTLSKLFEEIKGDGRIVSAETITEFARDHSNWRVRKLAEDESKEIIERNLQMIDLRVGMKKLPMKAMVGAINASRAVLEFDPIEFGKWADRLAISSITESLSTWKISMSVVGGARAQ